MQGEETAPRPVTVVVENEENKKFKIATADLEVIASQLRHKSSFSVFNSVVLPIGITVLTAILTTSIGAFFQYISWRNTVSLQEAQDRVAQAMAAYNKAAEAIDNRYYATFAFRNALVALIEHKTDVDSHLYQLDLKLNQERFDNYYTQIKIWNETNGQILSTIDFSLDRPVGVKELAKTSDIEKIDCSKYLTEEMESHKLNAHSLKLQFAIIRSCFAAGARPIQEMKDQAVLDPKFMINSKVMQSVDDALSSVMSSTNVFRCYALSRIEFLKSRQGRSLYVPWLVAILRPSHTIEARQKEHFDQTEKDCSIASEH